jgi:aromatic ring-opening dioxygenase catalytic subunit (LigB family)
MYDSSHPAHTILKQIGQEITNKVTPKALVVVSAHWEAGSGGDGVEVNFDEDVPLIYEYVFVAHKPKRSL